MTKGKSVLSKIYVVYLLKKLLLLENFVSSISMETLLLTKAQFIPSAE